MSEIAIQEPLRARAGVTWTWERQDLTAYPAPAWTLTYWLKQQGGSGAHFSIVAAANGAYHRVTVSAATTAGYLAGDYTWVAIASAGTDSYEVDSGTLTVQPKYSENVALDDRSHAKKVLDAIEAVIEGRASKDQQQYTIGNRALTRMPIDELLRFRARYKAEVAAEERLANGLAGGVKLTVKL